MFAASFKFEFVQGSQASALISSRAGAAVNGWQQQYEHVTLGGS